MTRAIRQLADYSALAKLAKGLWDTEGEPNGAAVMVGAGFSRAAATTGDDSVKLPLWADFVELLADNGGRGNGAPASDGSLLRLAEVYEAYHGRRALLDVIEQRVADHKWQPGALHMRLLGLPWAEVLTTNWDTLLERAADGFTERHYHAVHHQQDLARSRSPRITKLHGSIGVTSDVIFTQEDYRTYPQNHAAFVNFARQVGIENDLCLLGFSGDDPNFLQWVGWIRDNLAGQARNIYLVGVLNLSPMMRRYFASIHITPVDLAALVTEYDNEQQHREALVWLFDELEALKPARREDWTPQQLVPESRDATCDAAAAKAEWLIKQLPAMKADRESHPGWLVCPPRQRQLIGAQLATCRVTRETLAELSSDNRAQVLHELAWRHRLSFRPVDYWLAREMLAVADPRIACSLSQQQQFEVAQAVLDSLRWMEPEDQQALLAPVCDLFRDNGKYWPDAANTLRHHEAQWARDRLDYQALAEAADAINPSAPIWMLRKAGWWAELGHFTQAYELVGDAYQQLAQQHGKDRQSIYLLSRLAWAHWLHHGARLNAFGSPFEPFPNSHYAAKNCSPWSVIDSLRGQVMKAMEQQDKTQGIEPRFEPGRYKDKSQTETFGDGSHPLFVLDGLVDRVGVPLRWQNVNLLVGHASRILQLVDLPVDERFALAVRVANSESDEAINRVFSRIEIACLNAADAERWLQRGLAAMDYWCGRVAVANEGNQPYCISRLRVFMAVAARLVVRATPETAMAVFRQAAELGSQAAYQHFWLQKPLADLLTFALASVPKGKQGDLLKTALCFPLVSEVPKAERGHWPKPVIKPTAPRQADAEVDQRIAAIIENVSSESHDSQYALLRLLPLLGADFLTSDEIERLKAGIWAQAPDDDSLPRTGLLSWVLLELPCDNPEIVRERICHHLFDSLDNQLGDLNLLNDVVHSSAGSQLFPSEQRAVELFDSLVTWRPGEKTDPLGLIQRERRQQTELIARVLAQVVVPVLPEAALSEERFCRLVAFIEDVAASKAIAALPFFAGVSPAARQEIIVRIKVALQSRDTHAALVAAQAVINWCDQGQDETTEQLTQLFVYRAVYGGGGHRSAMLATIRRMHDKGLLPRQSLDVLVENLPMIFDAAAYGEQQEVNVEAVDAPLVRAHCLLLAERLLADKQTDSAEMTRIVEEGRRDVLPEVRFAEVNAHDSL